MIYVYFRRPKRQIQWGRFLLHPGNQSMVIFSDHDRLGCREHHRNETLLSFGGRQDPYRDSNCVNQIESFPPKDPG